MSLLELRHRRLIFFLVGFLVLSSFSTYSQCNQNAFIKSKTSATSGKQNGSIVLEFRGSGEFDCTLLSYDNKDRVVVKEIKGSREREITFTNLSGDQYYRVVVTFHDESEFLCRKRILDEIALTENSN